MVVYGHLGGRFSGSKKCHLFENISVDFSSDGLGRQIQEVGGDRGSGNWLASRMAFLQKLPNACCLLN
jgi:hypothetical protein